MSAMSYFWGNVPMFKRIISYIRRLRRLRSTAFFEIFVLTVMLKPLKNRVFFINLIFRCALPIVFPFLKRCARFFLVRRCFFASIQSKSEIRMPNFKQNTNCYLLLTVNRWRPLARRRLKTLRPPLVAMRARKPCVLRCFLRLIFASIG